MKDQVATFDDQQIMLAFALIADIETAVKITCIAEEEKIASGKIISFLSKKSAELGDWELVYNPAIYIGASSYAENTTMIFYNKKKKQMVVALAGTNATSSYDWFTEDFKVEKLAPWNSSILPASSGATEKITGDSYGYISEGTKIGIGNIVTTANKKQQLNPLTWLKENLKIYPTKKIIVTGHSLGGALAPVFALVLKDFPSTWNPDGIDIDIAIYAYAGPTPGDVDFRDYLESRITKPNLNSTINTKDVVPHAWQYDMLNSLFSIYKPYTFHTAKADNNGRIVYWLIEYLLSKSKAASEAGHPYERWSDETEFKHKLSIKRIATLEGDAVWLDLAIKCEWGTLKNKATIEKAIQDIVGNGYEDKCLLAFFRYFTFLGEQHVRAYELEILKCDDFLKSLTKVSKCNELVSGAKIIGELMVEIALYKKSQEITTLS